MISYIRNIAYLPILKSFIPVISENVRKLKDTCTHMTKTDTKKSQHVMDL